MRFTSLKEWLNWQQTNHPKEIDLGLARVAEVALRMGLLNPSARVITVAGTNGKGSCIAALEAILRAAGKRCGAYTSPHILHYNERVRIDAQPVDDQALCEAFEVIDQARGETSLTYFEFGTLAALYLFQREPLDYWLLEVGLGGRLDATNIIDADIAIVTSIDIDHVEWLGDNRESIGREKAGIFRAGKPAICADSHPPQSLLEHANTLGALQSLIDRDFGFHEQGRGVTFWSGDQQFGPVSVNLPLPSLAAAYHAAQLEGLVGVSELTQVFSHLTLAGRLQKVPLREKMVLLDVAHNPAAMALLSTNVAKVVGARRLAVVVAMMRDKDISLSLAPLIPLVDEWALSTISDLPRAASAEDLSACIPTSNKRLYASVTAALTTLSASEEFDVILVTGSFYTVAEAQSWLDQQWNGNEIVG